MSVRMEWNGGEVEAIEREAAERGIALGVEHLLGVSRQQVPHEEGTLERSGVATTDGLVGAVSYDTVYACRQHEELTWRHDAGRKAKYLEDPLESEAQAMFELLAATIRRALR